MQNAMQYCYEKAAPQGSPFYYSVLKLAKEERDAIVAVAAFYAEIEECLYESHEVSLVQTKLNWWRLEVSRLSLGQPEHPVSRVLQQVMKQFHLEPQLFADIIDGLEERLIAAPFESFTDVTVHIMRTAGVREVLIATIMQQGSPLKQEAIYQLSLVTELGFQMQNLRKLVSQGFLPIGEDELAKFHITLPMLQAVKSTPEIVEWLASQQEKAELAFKAAMGELTAKERALNASLIIRCELALRLMREIQSSQFQVMENHMSLTPLSCWWIASKVSRRLKKQSHL